MSTGRAVRIPRSTGFSSPIAVAPAAEIPSSPSSRFVPNVAGSDRGKRVLGVYLLILAAAYLTFLVLDLTSPRPGARQDAAVLGALTGVAAALAAWGWAITLGRAPRGVRFEGREIVVLERTGRPRRFIAPPALELRVLYRYPAGFLGRTATELVELRSEDGHMRAYLLERGFLSRI